MINLSDICFFSNDKIAVTDVSVKNYVSTENMMSNKKGKIEASKLPSIKQVMSYKAGDILLSNIRPYFKKIWFADCDGGCSNDVLVLRAKQKYNPEFLFYLLSSDAFFDYATATAKGTKMPRGDKKAIMQYKIPDIPHKIQIGISGILSSLDSKILVNTKINHHLAQIAQTLFKSWFVDFEPFGGIMPKDWRETELGEVATLRVGGDKPAICSPTPTAECTIPIFSNGIDNFGLYGYTDKPKITDESVTVSARGTVGYVCLRQDPFVPIVRLITAIPNRNFITAKYLYLYLNNIHIAGVGTTQQQLTVPDFKKYRILVPNFNVVKDFTQILAPIFEKIRHKQAENISLAKIRDAILPRLMSGELSVAELQG